MKVRNIVSESIFKKSFSELTIGQKGKVLNEMNKLQSEFKGGFGFNDCI